MGCLCRSKNTQRHRHTPTHPLGGIPTWSSVENVFPSLFCLKLIRLKSVGLRTSRPTSYRERRGPRHTHVTNGNNQTKAFPHHFPGTTCSNHTLPPRLYSCCFLSPECHLRHPDANLLTEIFPIFLMPNSEATFP